MIFLLAASQIIAHPTVSQGLSCPSNIAHINLQHGPQALAAAGSMLLVDPLKLMLALVKVLSGFKMGAQGAPEHCCSESVALSDMVPALQLAWQQQPPATSQLQQDFNLTMQALRSLRHLDKCSAVIAVLAM